MPKFTTISTFFYCCVSLSSTAIASSSDNTQQNDTSAEAVLDETGNVDLVDPRITIIDSKIKEAVREGTFGDGAPFTNEEDEDGFKLRLTSKGMVNSIEPMPDGVPKVMRGRDSIMCILFLILTYSSYMALYSHIKRDFQRSERLL